MTESSSTPTRLTESTTNNCTDFYLDLRFTSKSTGEQMYQ